MEEDLSNCLDILILFQRKRVELEGIEMSLKETFKWCLENGYIEKIEND